MMTYPPFPMTTWGLSWLALMVEAHYDGHALRQLWWQSSISPGGVNEHLTRTVAPL